MKPAFLLVLYVSVVFLPLILAWTSGQPPRPLWDELATGAGLVAFSIIRVEFEGLKISEVAFEIEMVVD